MQDDCLKKQNIDVYDFDKTVVPFDSALKYWGFCMLHRPWILILFPFQFIWGVMMGLRIISINTCKKWCFLYINLINNQKTVEQFWDKYQKYVFDWFKPENRLHESALASASPDFLVGEIAKRYGVEHLFCTQYDAHGVMKGKVCRKQEKVRRIATALPNAQIEDVYSDNASHDKYIFALGKRCFLAKKGKLTQFDYADFYGEKPSAPIVESTAEDRNSELQNN